MNFKKNWKRFWTLSSAREGFTLVELIVVIAILAILAGVAVPAYSGYVKKANRVADEQLLAALNTAFASACATNGENHYNRKDVTITLTGDAGAREANVAVSGIAGFDNAFASFYEGGQFKVFDSLYYNGEIGGFSLNEVLTFTSADGKYSITISSADLAALQGDNAWTSLGTDGIIDTMGTLHDTLEVFYEHGDQLYKIAASDAFLNSAGAYLGMDPADFESEEEYKMAVTYMLYGQGSGSNEALNNALVLYAAQNTSNLTNQQITDLFAADNIYEAMKTGDDATVMGNAAITYGMYVSYLQYCDENGITVEKRDYFANVVNTDGFKDYVNNTPEAQADLEAYLAAMGAISNNSNDTDLTTDMITNGFEGNEELESLLDQILGSN